MHDPACIRCGRAGPGWRSAGSARSRSGLSSWPRRNSPSSPRSPCVPRLIVLPERGHHDGAADFRRSTASTYPRPSLAASRPSAWPRPPRPRWPMWSPRWAGYSTRPTARLERLDGAQLDGPRRDAAARRRGHRARTPRSPGWSPGTTRWRSTAPGRPRSAADTLGAIRAGRRRRGLVLGLNRDGDPVVVRLFRPEPTRAALIGGLPCAETLVLRALAIGRRGHRAVRPPVPLGALPARASPAPNSSR